MEVMVTERRNNRQLSSENFIYFCGCVLSSLETKVTLITLNLLGICSYTYQ